jgi:hypothetical protein
VDEPPIVDAETDEDDGPQPGNEVTPSRGRSRSRKPKVARPRQPAAPKAAKSAKPRTRRPKSSND